MLFRSHVGEDILANMTPDHDVMAQVYRCLRTMGREQADGMFMIDPSTLASVASTALRGVSPGAAACGLAVFHELGLIETEAVREGARQCFRVRVREDAAKVELTDSVRYREGLDERDGFAAFCRWAFASDAGVLHGRVIRPIMPQLWQQKRRGNGLS